MTELSSVKLNSDGAIMRAQAPECVGISSAVIIKMLEHLEANGFQYHSLMLVRNGMVAAECYRHPFTKNSAHTMYSVSKTVTATAVGFAVCEGLLSLDTRIIDVFPERRSKRDKNGYIDSLTVRHLVSMMSGKLPSMLLSKTDDDWGKHFFGAKWVSEPGTKFDYVNENMYMACAVLHRVTGMSVVDFLMPRLFEPLKIERPFWETDGKGVEAGGWGIFLKTEDMAKLMLCYHSGGKWAGKQVIPAEWVAAATVNQHGSIPPVREKGYGYGIWVRNENEYYAGGMFTQISYIYEKQDCAAIVTACAPNESIFYQALDILKNEGFIEPDKSAAPNSYFIESLGSREIDAVPKTGIKSPLEEKLSGKTVCFKKNAALNVIGFPISVLHMAAVYMSKYRAGNIDSVRFDFIGGKLRFSWSEGEERNHIVCPMDGSFENTPIVLAHTPFTAAATAFWSNDNTLNVWIRPLESLCLRKLEFVFSDDGSVSMKPTSSPEVTDIVASVSDEIHKMVKNKKLDFLADKAIKKITELVEPIHKGKIR